MTIIHEKRCKRCNTTRPLSDFSPNPVSLDGHWHRCKRCIRYRQVTNSEYLPYADSDLVRCSKCHTWKSDAEFPKSHDRIDGVATHCLECHRIVSNDYVKRNVKLCVEKGAKWRKANKERHLETRRQWREKNAEQERERYTRWAKENPQKVYVNNHRRRARMIGNGGSYTVEEWNALCKLYDNRCLCCGKKTKMVIDHVIPVSKGGTTNIDNLQPLCFHCNAVKYDKIIDYRPQAIDSEV